MSLLERIAEQKTPGTIVRLTRSCPKCGQRGGLHAPFCDDCFTAILNRIRNELLLRGDCR